MNKSKLLSKYEQQLTLKNYSENTLRAYLNGLNIYLEYVSTNQIQKVTSEVLGSFFHHCKKDLGYSYSMMKLTMDVQLDSS
ncbi:phage integrase N-terminal SAM-like domain-containing protein [Pleurocapsales cyanobacterium LEGE 10410]|nr:phage integrase N-terminal SAM-like domain-containing protein [Pleurocapsales cyanobacterium LEGE 10410]